MSSKPADRHLLALERIGCSPDDVIASVRGYRPGRPPKYGSLALTRDSLMYCQKTKLGACVLSLKMSQLSGFEVTRLMKHHLITAYSPGLELSFATRSSDVDLKLFLSLLNGKNNSQIGVEND